LPEQISVAVLNYDIPQSLGAHNTPATVKSIFHFPYFNLDYPISRLTVTGSVRVYCKGLAIQVWVEYAAQCYSLGRATGWQGCG
jgi:hypothetical protein